MSTQYLDKTGLAYFWGKIKAYVNSAIKVTGVKGNAESSYRTGNVNLTPANIGAQATLVSGTNIKTINNQSILGSGNITIQGGGGGAVTSVNGQTGDVTIAVPSKVSELQNDSGYITGYTETDPTVPSWAKTASKPSYTASEVGALADTIPYISDFGTSNGWTYRKWANKAGTYKVMEMWGEWNNTSKTSKSDGGGYISVDATTPPNFPIAFAAKPIVNVSIDCGGQIVVPINMTRPTATSAGSWKGYRVSTNNGTTNKWFMFHVIGTYS